MNRHIHPDERYGSHPPRSPEASTPTVPLEHTVPRQRSAPRMVVARLSEPDRREVWGKRLFIVFPAVVAAMAAGILVTDGTVRAGIQLLSGLICSGAAALGVLLYRPRSARPWVLLGLGELCWTLAGVVNNLQELSGQHILLPLGAVALPLPTAINLAGSLPLAGALLAFGRSRWGERFSGSQDGAIIALGLGLIGYTEVVLPVLDSGLPGPSKILLLLPTMVNLLLLAALTRLLASINTVGVSPGIIAAGTACLMGADMLVANAHLAGGEDPLMARLLWLSAIVLVACAPLHPSMRFATDVAAMGHQTLSALRLTMLGVALGCPGVALMLAGSTVGPRTVWPVVLVGLVIGVLVGLRAASILRGIQQQAAQLADLAATDHLTGLPNRRSADAALMEVATASGAGGVPGDLVVAMLDLDHFKAFNDHRGHAAGDRLLAEAAESWRRTLPGNAMLFRFGGEEFLLVVRGLGVDGLVELVATMREVTPSRQSFSAGIAQWDGAESLRELVQRADVALYSAKAEGRNCSRVSGAPGHQGFGHRATGLA